MYEQRDKFKGIMRNLIESSINTLPKYVIYKATQAGKRLKSKEFRMTLATHLMSGYIHLIPKWPPFRYSFVCIEIRP